MSTHSVAVQRRGFSAWRFVRWGFLVFMATWLLAAGVYAVVRSPEEQETRFSVVQYLAEAKMSPEKSYPLKLGAPTAAELTNSGSPGFFLLTGHDAVAQGLQPSPNVRLHLQIGQYGSIIEVPFGKVNWITLEGVTSYARFTIKNNYVIDSVSPRLTSWNVGSWLTFQARGLEPKQNTIRDSNTWKQMQRNGVGDFLQNNLDRVYITLTPDQHAKYLGGF